MTASVNATIAGGSALSTIAIASNGAPSGGNNGDLRIRTDKPLAGVPYLNTSGVWAALNNSYTWAGRPSASSYTGAVILITDWGQEFYSDGTNWIPVGKRLQLICSAAVSSTITGARTAAFTDTDLIPANLVLPNCWFWAYSAWVNTGTAGAKNVGTAIGGVVVNEPPAAGGNSHLSTNVSATGFVIATSGSNNVRPQGNTTSANTLQLSNTATPGLLTIDFTVANTVTWNGAIAVGGDTTQCVGRRFEIYYP